MSNSKFGASLAAVDEVDVEVLIDAVGVRPPLYNKHLPEYSNRQLKDKLWNEVFEIVVANWHMLSSSEKTAMGNEVQKKWRHLKDNYNKEVAAQKKTVSGQALKKRKPYVHFEAMSFLAAQPSERNTSGNVSLNLLQDFSNGEQVNRPHISKKRTIEQQREEQILDILREKRIYDEDISFTEMLIPMLKKLNEDQKHFAKVEILNVLKRATLCNSSSQSNIVNAAIHLPPPPAPPKTPLRQVRLHKQLCAPDATHSDATHSYSPLRSIENMPHSYPNSLNPPLRFDFQYSPRTTQHTASQSTENQTSNENQSSQMKVVNPNSSLLEDVHRAASDTNPQYATSEPPFSDEYQDVFGQSNSRDFDTSSPSP